MFSQFVIVLFNKVKENELVFTLVTFAALVTTHILKQVAMILKQYG